MTTMTEMPLEQMCAELTRTEWANGPVRFIGDVGGTNARLGFGRTSAAGDVVIVYTRFAMVRKDINELQDFFQVILRRIAPSVIRRIVSGAVSVPGPVQNGAVGGPFNNLKGVARLADYPAALFPPGRSALLNDLQAGAFGVLEASETHIFKDHFAVMWEGTRWKEGGEGMPAGSGLGKGDCLIIAPGTGVGSSLIHYNGTTQSYDVIPLEFSSTNVSAKLEYNTYLRELAAYWGQPRRVPSVEMTSNGKAMEFHYFQRTGRQLAAKDIACLAKQGDEVALAAMSQTTQNLLSACGDATMTFLPLTCVLIGDNIVYNKFLFEDKKQLSKLREAVLQHPMEQYGFIGRTTYLRQIRPLNLNILGCFGFGANLANNKTTNSKL